MKKETNSINASTMADIAFLLLIFFLVATTMKEDKGIMVNLPPFTQTPLSPIPDREVLQIFINSNNELLIESKQVSIEDLKPIVMDHVNNNGVLENYSTLPKNAVLALKSDNGTSYQFYLSVYDEILSAYSVMRNVYSNEKFGKPYKNLNAGQKKHISKEKYPLQVSETEI